LKSNSRRLKAADAAQAVLRKKTNRKAVSGEWSESIPI